MPADRTWGLGRRNGHDLAAGHQLFGLTVVYDWCHADLDAEALHIIRATLERRGAEMATTVPGRRDFLQNHLWVDACGLATAGLAIYDKQPAARDWVACTLGKWRRTHKALAPMAQATRAPATGAMGWNICSNSCGSCGSNSASISMTIHGGAIQRITGSTSACRAMRGLRIGEIRACLQQLRGVGNWRSVQN